MRRRLLHRAGTLLAAVALFVAPLRGMVACEMSGADGAVRDGATVATGTTGTTGTTGVRPVRHGSHAAHGEPLVPREPAPLDAHNAHHGHAMLVDGGAERSSPGAPAPVPCDDLASCAVVALPTVLVTRAPIGADATAPRLVIADAPAAPVVGVEPPPPRA